MMGVQSDAALANAAFARRGEERTTPVDITDQSLLEECMARMAAGDRAYVITFTQAFAPRVLPVVRRVLTEMGRHDVLSDRYEVEALVQDACWVICERAGGWQPGKALPWTWAERAIRAEIGRVVGHRSVPVSDEHVTAIAPPDDVSADTVTLTALADRNPMVALLLSAVAEIGSPRDQQVFVEYRLQLDLRDPSPSHAVARLFGLSPANVRQIHRRMRVRLNELVATDARFAALEEVRWLAA
jgi:RNA polymerase sigma factor (sigma-70 family)